MSVPLLDLKAQHASIGDEVMRAVSEVADAQGFILGPVVEAFEEEVAEFLGVRHAVGCASGTDALLLPLRALEPEAGDEIILPTFTFFATAGAVWNAGFRPVFCDVDPVTFNVTRETVEARWSDRTCGVIPVHLFGQMAPMEEIRELARERDAFVLEDAAQAMGARQTLNGQGEVMAGAVGDAGAFSFFPSKNLGGYGDGGLISTNDDGLADALRKLRVHGGRQMYHHEMVGTNSRLDALQAAVLRVKLPHLPTWTEARRTNACRYHGALAEVPELTLPEALPVNFHVYNQYTVRAQDRDELRAHLQDRQIGSGVYYPGPLHLQPCFSSLGGREGDLPVAEALCREVLSLPVYPELGEEKIETVAGAIREFYGVR